MGYTNESTIPEDDIALSSSRAEPGFLTLCVLWCPEFGRQLLLMRVHRTRERHRSTQRILRMLSEWRTLSAWSGNLQPCIA